MNCIVTRRDSFDPLRTGLTIATTLRRLYPNDWDTKSLNRLLADQNTTDAIRNGHSVETMQAAYQDELAEFARRRMKYLLYKSAP